MKFTSERLIPSYYLGSKRDAQFHAMHLKTYYAVENTKGKTILDFGCGLGEGTNILAEKAKKVIGVDNDNDAVESAIMNKKITYINTDELPFKDNTFDIITCFQVFEHFEDVEYYIKEFKRVLKEDGILYLTTPNASVRLFDFQNPWNQHHVKEYYYNEIDYILNEYFYKVDIGSIAYLPKQYKEEKSRVFFRKLFMFPFTHKLIPNKLRQRILTLIWNFTVAKKKPKKNYETYDLKELGNNIIIKEKFSNNDFHFFIKCMK